MHGYGIRTWENGYKYEGMYEHDQKSGHGIYTWKSGKQYHGQWKENNQHGYGYMYKPKTGKINYGFW